MALRPTNELLWHLLSRLTPESRSFLLYGLGLGKRSGREDKPVSPTKKPDRSEGKLLAWRRPRRAYAGLLDDRVAEIRRRAAELEAERLAAADLADELLYLAPDRRGESVDGDERFQTLGLAKHLLDRSRDLTFRNPQLGREVAALGLRIIQRLDEDLYGPNVIQDFCGRAWSEVANAYRISSDHKAAERALRKAEACLHNSYDPLEKARLLNLKAALRKDQRRFEEALLLRDRAVTIYKRFDDRHLQGRTLNNKASDYLDMGEPEAAIECLRAAVDLLDPTLDLRITLAVHHNLTLALAEEGRFLEAAEAHRRSQGLYARSDSNARAKGAWVGARIALGLGRLKEAEQTLREVRREFQAREILYDFAIATLDLAFVCLRQGKTSEVKRLATEMMPIFKSGEIHREALAALTLFRQAVEQETVTVESLRKIIAQLERAPRKA